MARKPVLCAPKLDLPLALIVAALVPAVAATPAAAQFIQQTTVDPNSPVERLGSAIRILAGNPRNLEALMGAGAAALDVGDANAALGFFSRAEEISPSNGRAKAGLGAALANIEKPDDALRLFGEAASLGAPDTAFARDRALAYDLTGDWRRAQRDYQSALQINPADDETVRRYALSLGISGNRAQALQVLDPLLRRQDQGAWRARAFIYAMTGDVPQANTVARQLMAAPMAASMSPLLSRLATLNAAERAHAVNFGTVPSDGTRLASADVSRALPPPTLGGQGRPFVLQRAPTLAEASASRATSQAQPSSPSSGLIPAGEPLGRRPVPSAPVERPVQLGARVPLPTIAASVVAPVPRLAQPALPVATRSGIAAPLASGPLTTPRQEVVRLDDPFTAASVGRRIGPRIGPVDPARLPPELRGVETAGTLVPVATLPVPGGREPTPKGAMVTAPTNASGSDATRVTALPTTPATTPSATQAGEPTRVALLPTTALPTPSGLAATAGPAVAGPPAALGPPALVGPPAATAATTETQVFATPTPGFTQPTVAAAEAPPVAGSLPPVAATPPTATFAAPQPVTSRPAAPRARLAGLLSGLAIEAETAAPELPSVRELRLAQAATRRKAAEQTALAAAKVEEERAVRAQAAQAAEDARRNPARLWVQIATGANQGGLPLTWRRIRDANATALGDMSAYSVPFKATNRLLVGPVKSPIEARDLVRALARNGVGATTYDSDAGQEVVRVGGK